MVVSAPGKRFSGDNKITDLLYLCYAHIQYGVDYTNMLQLIKERYKEIVDGLRDGSVTLEQLLAPSGENG